MRYPIIPDDDSKFTKENIFKDLGALIKADKVYFDYDSENASKNKYFLFQLGMTLALSKHGKDANIAQKSYFSVKPIMPTSVKSYGNIISNLIINGPKENEGHYIILYDASTLLIPEFDINDEYKEIISSKHSELDFSSRANLLSKKNTDSKTWMNSIDDDMTNQAFSGHTVIVYDKNSLETVVNMGAYFVLKYFLDVHSGQCDDRIIEVLGNIDDSDLYGKFLEGLPQDNWRRKNSFLDCL